MRVTEITSRRVTTYTVTVEDGEVRLTPFTRTGRHYRVQQVIVQKRDGNVSQVELRGAVLKKDGTEGQNGAVESFYGQRDWPEWLHSIVGGLA
jgi:hypothetical protein